MYPTNTTSTQTTTTACSATVAEENQTLIAQSLGEENSQDIYWLNKAKSEYPNYDSLYSQACAVIETANGILGKEEKVNDRKIEYQVIKACSAPENMGSLYTSNDLSAIYASFCDSKEVAIIKNCYTEFCQGQGKFFDKIKYFKNHPKMIAVADLCALLPRTYLTTLVLTWNQIDNAGAARLAIVLPAMKKLTNLDLSWNNIGTTGAQCLAIALKNMQQLKRLNFFSNIIDDAGAKSLAAILPEMKELVYLNLSLNNIGDVGMSDLMKAITAIRSQGREVNIYNVFAVTEETNNTAITKFNPAETATEKTHTESAATTQSMEMQTETRPVVQHEQPVINNDNVKKSPLEQKDTTQKAKKSVLETGSVAITATTASFFSARAAITIQSSNPRNHRSKKLKPWQKNRNAPILSVGNTKRH